MTRSKMNAGGGAAVLDVDPGLLTTVSSLKGALDNLGTNVFIADTDLRLVYMNRRAEEMMRKLDSQVRKLFGVSYYDLIGTNIDVFHGDRARQIRDLLSNPDNLPVRREIHFANLILDLNVNAVMNEAGDYVGMIVNWEEISEKKKLELEAARAQSMLENMPINVLQADKDLIVRFMNPASVKQLKALQHLLPVKVEDMIGKPIDIFHKNPEHQRRMLADISNLPHRANIRLGNETLDLLVSATYDNNGAYIGPMVTWSVITEKLELETRIAENASTLSSSAEELTAISQQMAGNAEETATQANVVSTASDQVSKNVSVVAAAASSGQEPYSLAMMLLEMGLGNWNVQILGTDLSDRILARAREGRYMQIEVNRGLPAQYLTRYFDRSGLDWQLKDSVRRMVRFERFDLRASMRTKGPFDVIFCRNVLIYFDTETRKNILRELRNSLFPGGFIFLGGAETTVNLDDCFKRVVLGKTVLYQAP